MKKVLLASLLVIFLTGLSIAEESTCTGYADLMVKVYQLGLVGEDCAKIAYKRKAKGRFEAFFQTLIHKACLEGQMDRATGDVKDTETAHN